MTKQPEVKTMRLPNARTIVFSLLTSVFCFFATACALAQSASPQINSVQWDPIALGAMQCASGSGFGPTQGTVTINGIAAAPVVWADTQVCAYLPNSVGAGAGSIQISNAAGASNAFSFAVVADPVVTGVQPTTAGVGAQVTVTGTNFGSAGSVLLSAGSSGSVALGIVSWSGTRIVGTVPSGVQPGVYGLQVSTEGAIANGGLFYVVAPGMISSVQCDPIALGAMQCASGSGFGTPQGTVTINGIAAAPVVWADTQVCAYLPNSVGAGAGSIQISNAAGASNAFSFAVVADPVVTGVQPTTAGVGAQVTVTGTNFGSAGSVLLSAGSSGSVALGIVSWSGTRIVGTVPSGVQPGIYGIDVSTEGARVNGGIIFVVAGTQPSITTISPGSGAVGSQVTITGSGFGATQGTGTVSFNGTAASIVSWSDTQIVATVPTGATTGNVTVQQGGTVSNGVSFTVNPTPLLQFSIRDTPSQVNLTSPQNLDWVHWGRINPNIPDRKAGVQPLISDYTVFSGGQADVDSGIVSYSWSDGNQQQIVSATTANLPNFNSGSGFQITVPADTSPKILNLYVDVFFDQGQLQD